MVQNIHNVTRCIFSSFDLLFHNFRIPKMVITTHSSSTNKPSGTPTQDTPGQFLLPILVPAVTPKMTVATIGSRAMTPLYKSSKETIMLVNLPTEEFPIPATMNVMIQSFFSCYQGLLSHSHKFGKRKNEYLDHSDWILNKGYMHGRERAEGRRRFY